MIYSEKFILENQKLNPNISDILWSNNQNKIYQYIDTKINSFYLNWDSQTNLSYTLTQSAVTESVVFDHFVCKRLRNKKDDQGIKTYLERIIEIAYANKDIYLLYIFLPFKLDENIILKAIDQPHQNMFKEIISYKKQVENKLGTIEAIKLENNNSIIYFENNQTLSERTYLKYLLTNLPTTNKKIKVWQEQYFLLKLREIFEKCYIDSNGNLTTLDGNQPTLKNLNLSPLLIQYITKYITYNTLEDTYYNEYLTNKEAISPDIQFIQCANLNSGYANYKNKTVNFSPFQNPNINILFFLIAPSHEARHAIQDNCCNSKNPSIRNCHFEYIIRKLETRKEYEDNYTSEAIEYDSNRFAVFMLNTYLKQIKRFDIIEYLETTNEDFFDSYSYERLKTNPLYIETKYEDSSNKTIWNNQFERLEKNINNIIDDYPELLFFYEKKNGEVVPKSLLTLFNCQDLQLKNNINPFSSTFTLNYIRHRFDLGDFDEIITYLQKNNLLESSLIMKNLIGLLFTLYMESNQLINDLPLLINRWIYKKNEKDPDKRQKILSSYSSRLSNEIDIIRKLKLVSPKYPYIESKIIEIEKNYLIMLNVLNSQLQSILKQAALTTNYKEFNKLVRDNLRILNILLELDSIFNPYYQDNNIIKTINRITKEALETNQVLLQRASILFEPEELSSLLSLNNNNQSTILERYSKKH